MLKTRLGICLPQHHPPVGYEPPKEKIGKNMVFRTQVKIKPRDVFSTANPHERTRMGRQGDLPAGSGKMRTERRQGAIECHGIIFTTPRSSVTLSEVEASQ